MGYRKIDCTIRNKGFTLVELLVVISIISLLASIVLQSVNSARDSAAEAEHYLVLHEIDKALAMYYFDKGRYPAVVGWRTTMSCPAYRELKCPGFGYTWSLPINQVIPGLSPEYMPQMQEKATYYLLYGSDGIMYFNF